MNNYPTIKPSLNLDFANSKSVSPSVTFNRASTATYYDGKTVALAEQNLIAYSEGLNRNNSSNNQHMYANVSVGKPLGATETIILDTPDFSGGVGGYTGFSGTTNPLEVVGGALRATGNGSLDKGIRVFLPINAQVGKTYKVVVNLKPGKTAGNVYFRLNTDSNLNTTTSSYAQLLSDGVTTFYTSTMYATGATNRIGFFVGSTQAGEYFEILSVKVYEVNPVFEQSPVNATRSAYYLYDQVSPPATNQYFRINTTLGMSTLSFYAKADTQSKLWVFYSGMSGSGCLVDLVSGTFLTLEANVTGTITPKGNGWYFITFSKKADTTSTSISICLQDSINASRASVGDRGLFIDGLQLEQRSTATAYTPTTDNPITKYVPKLMTAAVNQPVIDHDPITGECLGLRVEEQRTNLIPRSVITGWTAGVVGSGGVLPTGWGTTTTIGLSFEILGTVPETYGDGLVLRVFGTANSSGWVGIQYSSFAVTAVQHARSIFVKQIKGTSSIGLGGTNSGFISLGGCPTTTTRVTGTYTPTAGTSYNTFAIAVANGQSYDLVFVIGGAQTEVGSFPTSYIPTNGSQVTRAADKAQFEFEGRASQHDCTFMAEFRGGNESTQNGYARILAFNGTNTIFGTNPSKNVVEAWVSIGTARVTGYSGLDITKTFVKAAMAFTETTGTMVQPKSENPVTTVTWTSLVPQMKTIGVGSNAGSGTHNLNGHIKRIALYPKALPVETLKALTA